FPQFNGHLGQLTDGGRGVLGGARRLGGDVLDDVHGLGHPASGEGLALGGGGDVLNQFREGRGYRLDLAQRRTGVVGQLGTLHHLGGGLLHGRHRFVGIGLNGLYQRCHLLGGAGGALREALYFVGNHREAAARVAGHGRLDGGVQSEDVGLVGNVGNQRHDVADLLGALAEALDPFGGVLDLLADGIHAPHVALYHVGAVGGDGHRAGCHLGGFGGVGRHLVDGDRHLVDGGGGAGDFPGLVLGGVRQLQCRGAGFIGGGGDVFRRVLNARHQFPQLENGEVDGVGDGAGEILGHRRLGGQITVTEAFDFVQQTQNGLLVLFVRLAGLPQAAARAGVHLQADEGQQDQGDQARHQGGTVGQGAALGQCGAGGGMAGARRQRRRRLVESLLGGLAGAEQRRGGVEDFLYRVAHEFELGGDRLQALPGAAIGDPADAEGDVAAL